MRVLELFAGIGGLALGLERAGFSHAGFVEIDPFCRAVLAKHWPEVPIHDDIKTFDATPLRGSVDLVSGGPPCQPASVAGKQKGNADPRWLWPDYLRVVRECQPRFVVAENVPGIRGLVPHGADWICEQLEAEGYSVEAFVVGADDVGAPHRRKRVFFVGHATGNNERRVWKRGQEEGKSPGGSSPVGYANDSRLEGRSVPGCERPDERTARTTGDETVVNATGPRCEAPGTGSHVNARVEPIAGRWPAGPGREQHCWEPPRTVPSLGRVPHGLPGWVDYATRRHRLKSLGNAVVPAVAEVIGRAILASERGR